MLQLSLQLSQLSFFFFFLNFGKIILVRFFLYFSFPLTRDPMGVKISKGYSSYKSQPKIFELFLNFLPNGSRKTTFGIFEISSLIFLTTFFDNFKFTFVAYGKIKHLKLSGNRAIVKRNRGKIGTRRC